MLSALEIARQADLKPIEEIAARWGSASTSSSTTARASPRSSSTPSTSSPTGPGPLHRRLGGQPDAFRRGQDDDDPRARPGDAAHRQAGDRRDPPGLDGTDVRHQGGGRRRRLQPGRAFRDAHPHLTGDMHAVTAAHNMLAAILDNHLYQGNELGIDLHDITWRRVLDVDDRALRNVVIGLGARVDGVAPPDRVRHHRRLGGHGGPGALDLAYRHAGAARPDRRRLHEGRRAGHRRAAAGGRRDGGHHARRPQAEPVADPREHARSWCTPGPFGNIAHGNSSIVADLIGIHCGDFLVTEAGFGADMGAERFFNIKCRTSGLVPDAGVVVATVRALKVQSGTPPRRRRAAAARALPARTPTTSSAGAANLRKQVENIRCHGVTPVIAINAFPGDFPSEHEAIREIAESDGGPGRACASTSPRAARARSSSPRRWPRRPRSRRLPAPLPDGDAAQGQDRDDRRRGSTAPKASTTPPTAQRQLDTYEANGLRRPADCIAKTQYSLSVGSHPVGRADRLAAAGARGAGLGRGGVHLPDLRRHVDDARARLDALGLRHRPRRERRDRRPLLTTRRSSSAKAPAEPGPCSRRS